MTAAARREQLLDVTIELVAKHGFHAISVQSVAARAKISRPIVYEHFGDLDGLLKAAVAREMSRALAQVSATELGDLSQGDPAELMLESLRKYLSAVSENPSTWKLVLMPPEGAPKILRRSIVRGRAAVLERLMKAVSPGSMPGHESPDPEMTARMLSTIADEYARLLLLEPARFPAERLLAHARWLLSNLSP
ncbi:MAG TPA: TetR/AcrR family transcriptional regulator [Solirubrobacteraceae bacterium]|nr:TetR/AcrR family transcriptional regulator [Solirubrobacteraceae bacterium]